MPNTADEVDEYNKILESEGMPAELRETRPRPTVDREWYNHFSGYDGAYKDACARLALDYQSTSDFQGVLADIRWGRHPAGELTDKEREVFEPFCEGVTEQAIADLLEISQTSVSFRLSDILSRYAVTTARLHNRHSTKTTRPPRRRTPRRKRT